MSVPMMNVWKVEVTMMHGRVRMKVAVRFLCLTMRMVFIVPMAVLMFERFMPVGVGMLLRQVEPQPQPHQESGDD